MPMSSPKMTRMFGFFASCARVDWAPSASNAISIPVRRPSLISSSFPRAGESVAPTSNVDRLNVSRLSEIAGRGRIRRSLCEHFVRSPDLDHALARDIAGRAEWLDAELLQNQGQRRGHVERNGEVERDRTVGRDHHERKDEPGLREVEEERAVEGKQGGAARRGHEQEDLEPRRSSRHEGERAAGRARAGDAERDVAMLPRAHVDATGPVEVAVEPSRPSREILGRRAQTGLTRVDTGRARAEREPAVNGSVEPGIEVEVPGTGP